MDIKQKMRQVPFGNSAFQIMKFTTNHDTPERSYRNILIQLDSKMNAMAECKFRRQRREIDIAENEEKMKTATGFELDRYKVNIEEAQYYLDKEIKLIEDCMIEIKVYEKLLEGLPSYSREDFENGEGEYWKTRLIKNAQREIVSNNSISAGVLEALNQIGCTVKRDDKGQFKLFENSPVDAIEEKHKTSLQDAPIEEIYKYNDDVIKGIIK